MSRYSVKQSEPQIKKYLILILGIVLMKPQILVSQSPSLEIDGAIKISNASNTEELPGTIRFNNETNDFEGWNGFYWASFTGFQYQTDSVTDVDGNVYATIKIENQEWMMENLQVTKYNDNTTIDQITNNSTWAGLSTGAWCWYDNNNSNDVPYGKLYNWYAVNTGKLCPTSWHVLTITDWVTLTSYLGGENIAGGKMKDVGTTYWNSPNAGATNLSGFTGLPGGLRNSDGTFSNIGNSADWWSTTNTSSGVIATNLTYNLVEAKQRVILSFYLGEGLSVRCVRD